MLNSNRTVLIVVGILFHLTYLWSIFDIYFVSPLVHGMKNYQSTSAPPAKRLFLIVGDGLRADTTFAKLSYYNDTSDSHHTEFLAPYLRSLILNNATYGVSHTRMPTESRPGHVAMIAGFYEDVSAVTKGWKENPVNFDSVLNQSAHTYSFGSPDILPMFSQGASSDDKVDTWMYGHEFEDFTKSSIELDAFVFQHLDDLFQNASINATLNQEIRQDQNVFFLHLLGCDTAGHGYRPYSMEYYNNVKYIDSKIEELIPKVAEFFGDDDTAFIVTADHGMSALGSHGDGHPNNTRTPLIAFGKGINKPIIDPNLPEFLEEEEITDISDINDWELSHVKRNDVKQADIASLMSYLIGINYASNSVGRLPLNYIDANNLIKLKSLYNNALEILEQYLVKETEVKNFQFNFKPFKVFEINSIESYKNKIELIINELEKNINNEALELKGIELTNDLIDNALEGLNYLQTYNWQLLRSVVTLGFIGWIVYSFMIFIKLFVLKNVKINNANFQLSSLLIYGIGIGLNALLFIQNSPIMYHIYGIFPIFFWQQIFKENQILIEGIPVFFNNNYKILVGFILFTISIFECITYGFFNRKIFSILFVLLGFYPILIDKNFPKINFLKFFINCLFMTIFTWSNAIKTESLMEINGSGILLIFVSIFGYSKISYLLSSFYRKIFILQIFIIISSLIITNISIISIQSRNGLPLYTQILNWMNIFITLILIPFVNYFYPIKNVNVRLLNIFLIFAPYFLILTISFETFFYVGYSLIIVQWIEIEKFLKNPNVKNDWFQLLRISIIGFFLTQIAFFGTGNIASISSFSLESVCRLIPIFDPFSMGALLMIKLIIPYILLSTGFGILNVSLGIKIFTISTLIISISDLLSLNFFFLVKTEGSWLDIGMTISNYCVAILSSLFIIILEFFSNVILKGVEFEKVKNDKDVEKINDEPISKRVRRKKV